MESEEFAILNCSFTSVIIVSSSLYVNVGEDRSPYVNIIFLVLDTLENTINQLTSKKSPEEIEIVPVS